MVFVLILIPTTVYAYPVGATEETEMSVSEAKKYLSKRGIKVPDDIREICEEISAETEVLAEILEAMAWKETRFKAKATSSDGLCCGILQVKPSIHKKRMERLGVTDIYDKRGNIEVGADYLRELLESNDLETALNKYNGSSRNSYGKDVIEIAQALEIAYWD